MIDQHANLMAYFDQVQPDLAVDPVEREKVSRALQRNLEEFDKLVVAYRQARADPRCTATLGRRPEWMSPDQYSPCRCGRLKGHEPPHACGHENPELVEVKGS